jgi:hypothetical protein
MKEPLESSERSGSIGIQLTGGCKDVSIIAVKHKDSMVIQMDDSGNLKIQHRCIVSESSCHSDR